MRVGRLVKKSKSGDDLTFVNYKGETKTAKYAPVGTIFMNDGASGPYLTFKLERGGDDLYFNIYLEPGVKLVTNEGTVEGEAKGNEGPRRNGGGKPKANESGDAPF